MLFVHNKEPQIYKARKNGKSGSDQDTRTTFVHCEPRLSPLALRTLGVETHDAGTRKSALHPMFKLRRELDLRNKLEHL